MKARVGKVPTVPEYEIVLTLTQHEIAVLDNLIHKALQGKSKETIQHYGSLPNEICNVYGHLTEMMNK